MKKLLFKALFAVGLFASINSINAQCSLDQVGAPNYSTTCSLSDMAVAPTGTVYTVSYNSTLNKIFLHGAVLTGSWTPLASISTSTTVKPIVAVNKVNGKVYVVIRDENAGKVCKVYYLSGGSLLQLGTAVSGSNVVSDLSIAFNSLGEEYVAYTDAGNLNKSTVKKWNGVAWVAVGTGVVSAGAGYYNSLMIDHSDTPILAYQDATTAPANKITVQKYNGASWVSMSFTSANPATNAKLKVANNTNDYYLGYTEISSSSAIFKVYNGSTWNTLGSPVTNLSSTANSFGFDLDPNDVPAFTTILSTPPYPVAYKYSAGAWNILVSYINSSTASSTNIGYDNTGTPYYFYVDQPANYALNVKATTVPITITSQPISMLRCNGYSSSFYTGVSGGTPGYQWQVDAGSGFVNAPASYSNATSPSLIFNADPTLDQNKVRCILNAGCKNVISNIATLTVTTLSVSTTFTNPLCFNTPDGAINSNVTGGTLPYTYSWSPLGQTTQNINSLYWNTYSLVATDVNGCNVNTSVTLVAPPSINTSFSGNQNICNGSSTTLTITATGGTPGYTYSWSPSSGLSTTTSSVVIASPSSSQTYGVSITDAIGCVATDTVGINVTALPSVSASNSTICAGNFATLNASGSAHTYTWNPGSLVGAVQNVNPGTTTTYTVVGTNTLTSCTNSATALVTVNPLPTVSAGPSRTLTCANTSTTLAGSTTGGITYSWTGPGIVSGATTLNPTINATGTYDLTVTSAFGCVAGPSPVTVFQNVTPPTATASNSSTLTCSTTTAALNGTGGGTYSWSGPGIVSGGATANPVVNLPGCYNLTVTAANGCTATANSCITQNTVAPSPTASNSSTLTCATTTVALTGGPAAGVTYQWSGPGFSGGTTSQNATANAAGTYSLKVTSAANGCTNTAITTVAQNTTTPSPTASTGGTLTCTTLTVSLNGTPGGGVSYMWSGPGISGPTTTQNTSANAPGIYTLTVVSAINGCSASATTAVTQNVTPPSPTATTSGTLTCTTTSVVLNGGPITGVTYVWSGPGITGSTTTQTTSANAPGNYTLVITGPNGCTNTAVTAVTQNTVAPSPTASTTGTLTCTTLTVSLNGGPAAGVTYLWTGPGVSGSTTTKNTAANAPGTYTLKVTGSVNGCTNIATTNVTQNVIPPSPTASTGGTLTCTTTNVSLIGTGGGTYTWNGPAIASGGATASPVVTAPGCYTVNVTAVNGCTANAVTCVTQNTTSPSANAGPDQSLTCASPTVSLIGSATPSSCTPVWAGGVASGANSFTATASTVNNYTLTVTNPSNGCTATDIVQVTANAGIPTLSTSFTNTLDCVNATATVVATTTVTIVMYAWSGPGIVAGGSTANATVNQAGSYSVTVTNTMTGCSSSSSIIVPQNTVTPSMSVSATPSLICSGGTATLTASGANTYLWDSGATTNTISVSPSSSTTYTVTGTDPNGCSINITQNITVGSTPSASGIDNGPVCTQGSIMFTNMSTTPTGIIVATQWSGPNSYTSTVMNPTISNVDLSNSGTYTLTVTNSDGCTNSTQINVTVNSTPTITVGGNMNICSGSTTNLTASGATSYTWSTGVNTNTISVTPTVTTTYTVDGDNGNGCSSSITTNVSVIANKAISGVITNTAGAMGGDVILYKYTPGLSQWDSVTVVPLASSYSFTNIDSALYVIRAIPTATNIQVTYADSAISWQGATIINHGCTNNTTQNIKLISLSAFIAGPVTLSGTIYEAAGFGQRMSSGAKPMIPGTPIGGIIIKGGKNPGGSMLVQTVTATDGTYTLTGLPINTSDEYFIFVDIPGLDTSATYHLITSTGNTQYTGLDFNVDSMYINPIGTVTGISTDNSVLDHKIVLFPNPAKQKFTLEYELVQSAKVDIELYDVIGNLVKVITPDSFQEKNKYSQSVNLENVSNGVYFVKLEINDSNTIIKLIVSE